MSRKKQRNLGPDFFFLPGSGRDFRYSVITPEHYKLLGKNTVLFYFLSGAINSFNLSKGNLELALDGKFSDEDMKAFKDNLIKSKSGKLLEVGINCYPKTPEKGKKPNRARRTDQGETYLSGRKDRWEQPRSLIIADSVASDLFRMGGRKRRKTKEIYSRSITIPLY